MARTKHAPRPQPQRPPTKMQRLRMMTRHAMVPRRPDTVESVIAVKRTEQGLQYKVSYLHGLYAHRNWKAPIFFEAEANKKSNKENQLSRFWSHDNRDEFVVLESLLSRRVCSIHPQPKPSANVQLYVSDKDDSEVVEDPDQLREELAREGHIFTSDIVASCQSEGLCEVPTEDLTATGKCYVVVSLPDLILVKPGDKREHMSWLVDRKRYEEALEALEAIEAMGEFNYPHGVFSPTIPAQARGIWVKWPPSFVTTASERGITSSHVAFWLSSEQTQPGEENTYLENGVEEWKAVVVLRTEWTIPKSFTERQFPVFGSMLRTELLGEDRRRTRFVFTKPALLVLCSVGGN
ncbi:hypothetical protein BDZ89DRAFT_1037133 [Hymenopellis radicata]|nr:hypothetical protein BDZ89DRAFT_1037133 [Hymenopellis radicata]